MSMLRLQQEEETVSRERWLVSYADFITLLFAFFTVLYASSTVDTKKLKEATDSVKQALGATTGTGVIDVLEPPIESPIVEPAHAPPMPRSSGFQDVSALVMLNELTTVIDQNELSEFVTAELTPRGIVITLTEAGFFDSGSARMRPEGYSRFAQVAMILSHYGPELRVEGHTDDRPIHTARFSSNWALSTARAVSVVESLVDEFGFPAAQLGVSGFGSFHPLASNEDAEGRAKNRRVELIVVGQGNVDSSAMWKGSPLSVAGVEN